jgi:hypothetical protein
VNHNVQVGGALVLNRYKEMGYGAVNWIRPSQHGSLPRECCTISLNRSGGSHVCMVPVVHSLKLQVCDRIHYEFAGLSTCGPFTVCPLMVAGKPEVNVLIMADMHFCDVN